MVAADLGDSEALTLLLEAGANVNCRVRRLLIALDDLYHMDMAITRLFNDHYHSIIAGP